MDKQTGKFIARIAENLPYMDGEVMQSWIDKPKELQSFLLGLNPPKEIISTEEPLDFIVRVDRTVRPTYPDWFKKLEHPELECSGPAKYDLQTAVKQWLHNDQKHGLVQGDLIFSQLNEEDVFASCLNLQDSLAIQQKGLEVFRKLFGGKAVFFWGSVVQDYEDDLLAPFLRELDGEVVLRWYFLEFSWNSDNPALRFSK